MKTKSKKLYAIVRLCPSSALNIPIVDKNALEKHQQQITQELH